LLLRAISYTAARGKLADTMNKVCENHDPVIITRRNESSVVILSLEDYEALNETNYLLQSPKNARRLLSSLKQLNDGKGKAREMIE
jgi:antitoxin YefM